MAGVTGGGFWGDGSGRQGGHVEIRERPSRLLWRGDREGRSWCLEAPVPTVSHVVRVVEAQLKAGWLGCLVPGCGGVLRPWWYGVPREIAGLDGAAGRGRPRRGVCGAGGRSGGLAPDPQ